MINSMKLNRRSLTFCQIPVGIFCVLTLILSLSGCTGRTNGPTRVAIEGFVTIDGEPLQTGLIKFIPKGETKGPVAVLPVKDGNYRCSSIDGPVEGEYRVEIEKGLDDDLAEQAANPKEFLEHLKRHGNPIQEPPLPQKYNRQSTLTADVAVDEYRFDFDLENSVAENTRR